jgi:hypothetical protein
MLGQCQGPRGGVVTHRTANPRTPVRFRAWPPFSSCKISAFRETTSRYGRHSWIGRARAPAASPAISSASRFSCRNSLVTRERGRRRTNSLWKYERTWIYRAPACGIIGNLIIDCLAMRFAHSPNGRAPRRLRDPDADFSERSPRCIFFRPARALPQ